MRRILVLVTTLAVILIVNLQIWHKETVIQTGQTVLLPLAPADPRSLMQGDYMVLRYRIPANLTNNRSLQKTARAGFLVLKIDDKQVAKVLRIYKTGESLAADERLIKYRLRSRHAWNNFRIGAESYFFQEGTGKSFESACFGELRLAQDGSSVLVGLRDAEYKRIKPELNAPPNKLRVSANVRVNPRACPRS